MPEHAEPENLDEILADLEKLCVEMDGRNDLSDEPLSFGKVVEELQSLYNNVALREAQISSVLASEMGISMGTLGPAAKEKLEAARLATRDGAFLSTVAQMVATTTTLLDALLTPVMITPLAVADVGDRGDDGDDR